MKYLKPIITEKSTALAKEGKYTFIVDKNLNKFQIKELVEKVFEVGVVNVNTINISGEIKRTLRGRTKKINPAKKVIVTLKDKDKIDLFEEKSKKKKG